MKFAGFRASVAGSLFALGLVAVAASGSPAQAQDMEQGHAMLQAAYVEEICSGSQFSQDQWSAIMAQIIRDTGYMPSLSEMLSTQSQVKQQAGIGACASEGFMSAREMYGTTFGSA